MINNQKTIESLRYEGCTLFLSESQSRFLSEKINFTNLSLRNIRRALFELRVRSCIRLYSLKDIEVIALGLYEALGRNYASKLTGDSGNIRKNKILSKNHNIDFDIGVDVYRQSTNINDDSNYSYFEDTKFDDESDANIAIDRFYIKNINKL